MLKDFFTKNGKKILIGGVMSILMAGVWMPNISTAQTPAASTTPANTSQAGTYDPACVARLGPVEACKVNNLNNITPSDGSIFDPTTWFNRIIILLGQSINSILSVFLGLSGLLLDYIINYTVVHMADNITKISGINVSWRIIRDLCNMSFIFVLVYYGIKTIFGQIDGRKIIFPIVIAAALINFALFFTKVMIDVPNIVAVSFYNSIIQGNTTGISDFGANIGVLNKSAGSLTGAFMKNLHITHLFSKEGFSAASGGTGSVFVSQLGSSLLILIATFCFLAMSVLFLIRYIIFIVLLAVSPVGYVSSGIPGLKSYSKKYWDALLNQGIFAPVFMIMTWVTLTIANSPGFFTAGKGNLGQIFSGEMPNQDSIGLLINYFIIIGLMILTMKVAKDTATSGAKLAGTAVGKVTAFAGGTIFGGAAKLGRGTLGARANAWANDEELKKKASEKGFGGLYARAKLKTFNKTAGASFDARGTGVVGTFGKESGLELGKAGGKGGYAKTIKDKLKEEEEFAKSLKPSDEYTDAKKKEMATKLNNTAFIREEEKRREDYFNGVGQYAEEGKSWNDKYKKDYAPRLKAEQARIDEAERSKTAAEAAHTAAENTVNTATAELTSLNQQLANAQTDGARATLASEIAAKKEELETLEQTRDLRRIEFEGKKDTIEIGKKNIENLKKQARAELETWISDEKKAIISAAGGQDEKKDKKTGALLQQKVNSENAERVESYAKTFTSKAEGVSERHALNPVGIALRAWNGNPQINKAAAAKIRGINKAKSGKDKAAEAIQAISDEAGDATPAPEPAAPTTPTPPTPPGP